MSIEAMAHAKKVKTGSPAQKLILLCIADYVDQWGWAFASQELMAEEAEVNVRTVRRHIRDLAKAGIIVVYRGRSRRGNLFNLYQLADFTPPAPKRTISDSHPSQQHALERLAHDGRDDDTVERAEVPEDNLSSGPTGQEVQVLRTNEAGPKDTAVSGKPKEPLITSARERASAGAHAHATESSGPRHWRDPSDGSTKVAWQGERGAKGSPGGPQGEAADVVEPKKPPDIAAAHWGAWQDVRLGLRREVGAAAFKSWIDPLTLAAVDGGAVRIRAPSGFIRDRVRTHYGDVLRSLVGAAFGAEEVEIIAAAPASAQAGAA